MEKVPLFNDTIGVMAVITMITVLFLWLEKKTGWKIFDYLPAIIWIFLTPILLSNLNIIPKSSPIYSTFRSFAVPMFIVLMLLDINIRETMRVAWRGAAVMTMGSVGIVIGCVVAFFFFRGALPADSWSGFGALAGSWIGGTGNLAAVAESLDTPESMVGIVVIVDNFVYLAYFPVILTCKRACPDYVETTTHKWPSISFAGVFAMQPSTTCSQSCWAICSSLLRTTLTGCWRKSSTRSKNHCLLSMATMMFAKIR